MVTFLLPYVQSRFELRKRYSRQSCTSRIEQQRHKPPHRVTLNPMDRIGRYKIVRELGRGAMGVVYHAIDPNIGRPVAIKTIPLGGNRTPEEQERLRERLFREARSAG